MSVFFFFFWLHVDLLMLFTGSEGLYGFLYKLRIFVLYVCACLRFMAFSLEASQ